MRTLWRVFAPAAAVAGCTTAPPQSPSAAADQELQRLLAGKVAGEARSCLPNYRASAMVVIDDDTIVFRDGARRVWRTELVGHCALMGSGHYTLVTRSFGGKGPCRGDISHLVDLSSGMTAGSCVWGDFVPYSAVPR